METEFPQIDVAAIERLRRLAIPALQRIHRRLFKEDCPVYHASYLRRKLAWELQARIAGGLPEGVRQHALGIAWQAVFRTHGTCTRPKIERHRVRLGQGILLPPAGAILRREFKGKSVTVRVLETGFEYDGRVFGSLSPIAKLVTGVNWNGLVFFGLKDVPATNRASGQQAPAKPGEVRCAIYTRKSTEEGLEQEFNTLDAQREAAESFIRSQKHEGWTVIPTPYDDGGFTGANMDRPALNLLLSDIALGKVNCVVVYKVDRLTRSLLDFSRIMDVLDRHGATFVAVTQQFNTTSSLGRLTLNILLSFAQFEREMISERTRDKMSAARRRGKWTGGRPVLGYDVAPGGGALVVNEEEAVQIREIFRLYLELGSTLRILDEIEKLGWRLKSFTTREGRNAGNARFTGTTLHNTLTNPIYTGKVRHRGEIYPGEHERIISDELWDEVQKRLSRDNRRGRSHATDPCGALLKGLVRCGSCDRPMTHTYAKKKSRVLYRYYVCGKAHRTGWKNCETKSVSAPALEQAVLDQLEKMATEVGRDNEVKVALEHAATSWRQLSDDRRRIFIRTLVSSVRFDGRTGTVVMQFAKEEGD